MCKKKTWENGLNETKATNDVDFNDYIEVRSIFSGIEKSILSKNFQGGSISCIFGGVEIDFSKADFKGRAVVNLEAVFGGIKLILPPTWTLQNDIHGIFHGIDDKRAFSNSGGDADKILVLRGSAVFAGIDVKSY